MIITDDQREYLGSRFEHLYDLHFSSSLDFPYGLPGWKDFVDMEKMCSRLLALNRLTPLPASSRCAARQWMDLIFYLNGSDDGEENLVHIVQAIPTIVAKMHQEHIYGT